MGEQHSTLHQAKVPAATYSLDPEHASLLVHVPHTGGMFRYWVRFYDVSGDLTLNPARPEDSAITLEVDPRSLRTPPMKGYKSYFPESKFESWDQELAERPDLLNGLKFPTIRFKSTRVTRVGSHDADIEGKLTFLGVRKPVTMRATYNGGLESHFYFKDTAVVGFHAEGWMKRSDFGMEENGVSDEVQIFFDGQFLQKHD